MKERERLMSAEIIDLESERLKRDPVSWFRKALESGQYDLEEWQYAAAREFLDEMTEQ